MLYPNVWEGTAMSRHINKAELISKVRQLDCLTNEEKSALLELLNEKKMYGLVWENHEEAVEEQLREQLPVFREVPERRILSDDADAPNHIIIEAENLHALVALTYTHAGKIDVMYLDPPYNTGNKDFVYNDSYVDSEDSYRHSKWLSFMEKRLKIAKTLLSEKGVIMISIDNHEYANLKLLCDGIFGEQHLLTVFVWETDGHTDNQEQITDVHEYILCYSKTDAILLNNVVDPNVDQGSKILRDFAENSITKNGIKNPPSEITLPVNFPCEIDDLHLEKSENVEEFVEEAQKAKFISRELTDKYNMVYPARLDTMNVKNGKLKAKCRVFSGWSSASKLKAFINNDCNPIEDKDTMLRYYLSKNGVIYYRREGRESHYVQTILRNLGTTETNKYMLEKMGVRFDYPKPVELISFLLSLFTNSDSIILDFFAGSGTTLHATMLLNKDGGKRQCISATNNENQICEKNYTRNSTVICRDYESPKGEKECALTSNNLRYYKADFISREPNSKNKRELVKAATDLLCIKENLYQEVKMTCNGKTLRKDYARRFADGEKEMIIIYEPAVIKYIVEELKTWAQKEFIKIYVFSEGRYAYDDDFKDVIEKVTLCALPDAIYQAYRRVLPQRKKSQQVETIVDDEEMKEALADAESYSYQEEKGGKA